MGSASSRPEGAATDRGSGSSSTDGESARPRELFGKYEILRRLAIGGMAEIHLARARGLEGFEKLVVLKRILPQYADNEEFVAMFLDEARLAAHLHHSNIVQVYDIGLVDLQYFLSMEFLHGQDLRHLTKTTTKLGQPVPLEHALTIMIGVLAGLHYAHTRVVDGRPLDLVHRDVSPQNVFVTYDGGVKLLDFGIARASSRLAETRAGTLKGKTAYMSPEQCRGLPLDRRSDVFAAAIMLWELTTGRRLYTGDSELEILRKIREEDPPRPSSASFAYPLALERIVTRGLKRDRDERYGSAEEMQLDLETFAREQGMALSSLALARYLREVYREQIEAWQDAERAGVPLGEHLAQTVRSSSLVRTETSVSGPPPPIIKSDPAVAPPVPRARRWSWLAVAAGLVAGSLITWMLARPSARRETPRTTMASSPSPARIAVAPAPMEVPAALARPAARAAVAPTAREAAPAPTTASTSTESPAKTNAPVATPAKTNAPVATPANERASSERAPAREAARAKPRPKRPARHAAKTHPAPSAWNPDSMLPP
jgi:serine/threonine protein kinase